MIRDHVKCYMKEQNNNCAEALLHAADDELGLHLPPESFRLIAGYGGGMCRKVKTMGFLMRCALSSFSFLCNEEIFSISSNLIIQLFFLPSAVKVAFTSAVPFKLTYQSKVVSEVGVTI